MAQWLIDLLNVVYSIIVAAGSVVGAGALVGIAVNLWRDYLQRKRELEREKQQRQREREGLLMILALETEQNARQLISYKEDSTWIVRAPSHTLSTRMWEATMVRLSQLLEEVEFADLIKYYENVWQINGARQDDEMSLVDRQDTITQGLPQLQEQSDKARAVINKYVDRDAFKGTLIKNITFDPDPERWGEKQID